MPAWLAPVLGIAASPLTWVAGAFVAGVVYGDMRADRKCEAAAWQARYDALVQELTIAQAQAARAEALETELAAAAEAAAKAKEAFLALGDTCTADQSDIDRLYDIIGSRPAAR